VCTFKEQMALKLRNHHDLRPVMTGWQSFVAAERIVPASTATANDQQPRGY
jgi:hypothetical protein